VAVAVDLELRLVAASVRRQQLDGFPDERQVARTPAVGSPAERVDAPDELGIEADPGREDEAPTGSIGMPSARATTFLPPPGTIPTGTAPSTPLTTSLRRPSPP
jgi:hypothetical protein